VPYDHLHRSPDQDRVLTHLLDRARAAGPSGVVALDLDGCLFDNRPRQVQIVRTWAAREGDTRLEGLRPDHFQDWDFAATFQRLGLEPDEARHLALAVRPFWEETFFDAPFVVHDLPVPGAARFARELAGTGVRVVYLTGRLARQDPSTLANLRRFGFPVDDDGEVLWSNPGDFPHDRDWKVEGFRRLVRTHDLVAFVDNEPGHVRHVLEAYPEALAVWVDTDHSPGAEPVPDGTPTLRGFLRTTDRCEA
jgi:hypothetical protein